MSLAALSPIELWFRNTFEDHDHRLPQRTEGRLSAGTTTQNERSRRDAAWVHLIRNGDAAAFSDVFHEYYGPLCAFALTIVRDKDSAEDLVDDLFANLWMQHESLNVHMSLTSYLYRSARNSSLNHIRNRKTRSDLEARWIHSDDERDLELPSTIVEQAELAVVIETLLAQLPERRREVVLLRWKAGMSHAEIAEVLGIAVQSVANLLNRALHDLRRLLPRDFD